jgi:hypothetical protein
MNPKQMEEKVIEFKRRVPFVPFVVELVDGNRVEVSHAGLAITADGFGFLAANDAIVDVEFRKVQAIRPLNSEAAA